MLNSEPEIGKPYPTKGGRTAVVAAKLIIGGQTIFLGYVVSPTSERPDYAVVWGANGHFWTYNHSQGPSDTLVEPEHPGKALWDNLHAPSDRSIARGLVELYSIYPDRARAILRKELPITCESTDNCDALMEYLINV